MRAACPRYTRLVDLCLNRGCQRGGNRRIDHQLRAQPLEARAQHCNTQSTQGHHVVDIIIAAAAETCEARRRGLARVGDAFNDATPASPSALMEESAGEAVSATGREGMERKRKKKPRERK